jgi:hypothetical protein
MASIDGTSGDHPAHRPRLASLADAMPMREGIGPAGTALRASSPRALRDRADTELNPSRFSAPTRRSAQPSSARRAHGGDLNWAFKS